mmetsp:Transcript_24443/g.49923  ORF Transcript_24443/g.49923 Transcript_24443/m.49923 type:complete len:203 (+) Transcript_24443:414-1022(+)
MMRAKVSRKNQSRRAALRPCAPQASTTRHTALQNTRTLARSLASTLTHTIGDTTNNVHTTQDKTTQDKTRQHKRHTPHTRHVTRQDKTRQDNHGQKSKREKGREDLQDQVLPVPHRRRGRRAQAGSESLRILRKPIRKNGGIFLLQCQQEGRRHVERREHLPIPRKPQEIHEGKQDGLCRTQEATRQTRYHRVSEEDVPGIA